MSVQLARDFYRLALASAKKRDLSRAVVLARHALRLAPEDERALRLLDICLFELEDTGDMDLGRIRELAASKKWKKAKALALTVRHRSVRVFNIYGCLYAASGDYTKAARLFARALQKDSGNLTARVYLTESLRRKKGFSLWRVLGLPTLLSRK